MARYIVTSADGTVGFDDLADAKAAATRLDADRRGHVDVRDAESGTVVGFLRRPLSERLGRRYTGD